MTTNGADGRYTAFWFERWPGDDRRLGLPRVPAAPSETGVNTDWQAMQRQSQRRGGGCDRERIPDICVYGSFVQEDGSWLTC